MAQHKDGKGGVAFSTLQTGAAPQDHLNRMRQLAQERLVRLFDEAASARFFGRIMVEVSFENGRPMVIHRRIEGVDK